MLSGLLKVAIPVFLVFAVCLVCVSDTDAVIHEIDVGNFFFSPTGTVVSSGDTVRWNFISGTHTSTSTVDSPKAWNSGNQSSGSFDVVFTAADGPGPFPYLCSIHPTSMKDTIFMELAPPFEVTTELVADGLTGPIFVTAPNSDSTRLFVVEKGGNVKIIKDGGVLSRPFLDITVRVNSTGNEQGLLGLAFHPAYPDSGYFYVNYIGSGDSTHVSRFSVTGDPDSADAASEKNILTLAQPFTNHNAGMLAFGPSDGYLYIGLGDGGGSPGDRPQNPGLLLGKMLRVDVNSLSAYEIPLDNPYVGQPDTLDEIWAFGFRNPWRWSFDRLTGELYIGDVGQSDFEEIDFEPGSSGGGFNYGWPLKEGSACYTPPTDCDPLGITTDPIHEYPQTEASCFSITGGYVYRGCAIPDMAGYYFFGDFCTGVVEAFAFDGETKGPVDTIFQLTAFNPASFGEDAFGELYIAMMGSGEILKIVPDGVPSQCPDLGGCCSGFTGNINCSVSDDPDISDITALIDFLYLSGTPLCCAEEADVNKSGGEPDISDITALIDNLYLSHTPLPLCP